MKNKDNHLASLGGNWGFVMKDICQHQEGLTALLGICLFKQISFQV